MDIVVALIPGKKSYTRDFRTLGQLIFRVKLVAIANICTAVHKNETNSRKLKIYSFIVRFLRIRRKAVNIRYDR